jgi:predicted esterase
MKNINFLMLSMLLLAAASSGLAQNIDSANIFLDRANQALKAKDYQAAVREYRSSLRHYPDNAVAAYNAACCYSLLDNGPEALKLLERAVDLGFYKFDDDADLDNIRSTGQYKKILARAQRLYGELKDKMENPVTGLPRDYDSTKTYGLLVALHGSGSEPNTILENLAGVPQKLGYIVMAPYGTHPFGPDRFNWNTMEDSEQRVLETIQTARARYHIDPSRIILFGFSLGGTVTYYVGTKNAGLFRGIIPVAGTYDTSVDQFLPRSRENGLKVCIMFGDLDHETVVSSNQVALKSFILSGVTASLTAYARLGHAYPPRWEQELQRAIEWVEKN